LDLVLSGARLRPWLLGLLLLVVSAGVGVEVLKPTLGLRSREGAVPLLSLSYEWNIPTLYTAALLCCCAASLAIIAAGTRRQGGSFVARWRALSVGFLYIALDELLGIHEAAGGLVDLDHLIHFDWIVPASFLLLALGVFFLPFLRHLPPPMRNRFLLAGAIYVGGAVGMELPLGWWTARHGAHNLGYALIDAVEESLEMIGLNLFLLALLDHLADSGFRLGFRREVAVASLEP
jgi:hypothetical protein